ETLAAFDPDGRRTNYLRLQEHLCDLRLAERRALGEELLGISTIIESQQGAIFRVWFTDRKPDFLYLIVAARGVERPKLLRETPMLLLRALINYEKQQGMAIIDREGVGFEVILTELPE